MACLLFAITSATSVRAQNEGVNERAAKDAVHRIVRHSGLLPTFVVRENRELRTAVAFIRDGQRVIEYNPGFLARVVDSSRTDWSAVSILAHEIAHHLLGHTLDPQAVHPGDELACDRYSGFILHAMGATLQESLAAIEVAGDPHGSNTHPPKQARAAAIKQGWEEARDMAAHRDPEPFTVKSDLRYTVHLIGDQNTYYVDTTGRMLWFDNYAEPIEFGRFGPAPGTDFTWQLDMESELLYVDARMVIWRRTATGLVMKAGRLEDY